MTAADGHRDEARKEPGHWACGHEKKKRVYSAKNNPSDWWYVVWCDTPGCPEYHRLFIDDSRLFP
jgi:hypothetical protein